MRHSRSMSPMGRKAAMRATQRSAEAGMTLNAFTQWLASRGVGSSVNNPYAQVSAVYACVRKKANALAMLPMRISTVNDEVLETGPLVDAVEQPGPGLTGRAFRRAVSAWLDLFGKVHIVKRMMGSQLLAYAPVSPLELTEHRTGPRGEITSYTYTPLGDGSGHTETLLPEQVHTIVDPDFGSGDLTKELSPRRAAALAISQHYRSDVANERSLKHGVGGGFAATTPNNLDPEQRKLMDEQLNEKYAGEENRHRWMLFEGGLTVERLFSTFAEMEFTELKYFSREDICVSFDVNPLVVGYGGREGLGSGQHTDAAHLIFWTDTMLPRSEWIAEEWMLGVGSAIAGDRSMSSSMRCAERRPMLRSESANRVRRELGRRAKGTGSRFYAWFDASGVPVLQKASLELAKQAETWIERGVPLNQVLGAYDLPFEEVPWGNTWYKPFGLVDVQDESEPAMPGDDDPPGGDDLDELDDVDLDKGLSRSNPDRVARLLTETQRDHLWRSWRLSWAPLEREFRNRHTAFLYELRKEVLRRLDEAVPKGLSLKSLNAIERRDLVGRIVFDIVVADGKLMAKVGSVVRETFQLGGAQSMAEAAAAQGLDKPERFNAGEPRVEQAMRRREIRIKDTNRTLRRRLAGRLAEGVDAGESTSQLADRIRKEFNVAATRAKTIARTEVGGAIEDARQEGRRQANVPAKSWLGSKKETSRPWHMEAERKYMSDPIPNDRNFELPQTGAQTPHPRGPGLTAEDATNCGCTTLARFPNDAIADGRVIGHYVSRGFMNLDDLKKVM